MIKITFLGTSDAIPTAERNHTSIWLSYNSENILVDCGEGTQRQIRRAELNPCKITKLLITHWHGDHILGIPGLLQTMAFSGYNRKLEIYGPKGTKRFMEEMMKIFGFVNKIELEIKEVENGKFFENEDFFLESKRVFHGEFCNSYNFVERDKNRIDKKELKKSKLPSGELIGKLKEGKDILFNGKKYSWKKLTYEEKGRKVSFVLDTAYNESIVHFVKDADLLISEAEFGEDMKELAKEHEHMTSAQAGEIAKKAKVKKLFITHISQRYAKDLGEILKQTRKVFKNTEMAKDFLSVEI